MCVCVCVRIQMYVLFQWPPRESFQLLGNEHKHSIRMLNVKERVASGTPPPPGLNADLRTAAMQL